MPTTLSGHAFRSFSYFCDKTRKKTLLSLLIFCLREEPTTQHRHQRSAICTKPKQTELHREISLIYGRWQRIPWSAVVIGSCRLGLASGDENEHAPASSVSKSV